MSGWFTWGGSLGIDSRDYDLLMFEKAVDRAPMYGQAAYEVPGRNGDLLLPVGRIANIEHIYTVVIARNIESNLIAFRNDLVALSRQGYLRLEDSWGTDEYYLAYAPNAFEPIFARNRKLCKFELVFNRKPQRFLTLGETVQTFTSNGSIGNPTNFAAQPLIRIYGSGVATIGNCEITVNQVGTEYTDIDCAIMECFEGAESRNQYVEFSTLDFPVLPSGSAGIELGTGVTKIEITPRWWRM